MLPVENHKNKESNKLNLRNVIRTSENWKTESKRTEDLGIAKKIEAYISYAQIQE